MFYEVQAKCGHVGRNHYVIKSFAIKADSAKEAARICRYCPRVKHHHKDAIIRVICIDELAYYELQEKNRSDYYFNCRNIQEQRLFCDFDVVYDEPNVSRKSKKKSYSKRQRLDYIRERDAYDSYNYCY